MRHATTKWETGDGDRERARGGYRPTAAGGCQRATVAKNLFVIAVLQLSSFLRRAADFLDWHLDAEYRPGMAGLRANRVEDFVGSGRGSWFDADDAFLDLGRISGRSAFQAPHRFVHASMPDGFRVHFCRLGLE